MSRLRTLIALPFLLAACESDPNSSLRAGRFSASVSGAVTAAYEGGGEFHTGTPGPGMQQFQIISNGRQGFEGQQFALTRWDGGRLRTGRHEIGLVDLSEYMRGSTRQPQGITFQYFRVENGIQQQYVADSGEVEITSSSDERVAGRFTITALRYCVRDRATMRETGSCDISAVNAATSPKITVTGTFVATLFEPGPVIAE